MNSDLLLLVLAVFFINFGQGLFDGASANFFVNTLQPERRAVLWLQGIREIPGLLLVVIAALTMRMPPARRAALSVVLMGVGFGLYAVVHSYLALVVYCANRQSWFSHVGAVCRAASGWGWRPGSTRGA